jgi:double zinc ribbon protein
MKCPRCQHENEGGARFCEECAAPLARVCANCGAPLSVTAKFCSECAHPAGRGAQAAAHRFGAPEVYTPKRLAEKILTSMELLADRDPEEARKLLDPVLKNGARR